MGMKYTWTKIKRAKHWVWGIYYRTADGKRLCHSTGKTLKYKAQEEAEEFLAKLAEKKPGTMTLRKFAENFFDYDTSPWIKAQHEWGQVTSTLQRSRKPVRNRLTGSRN